MRRFIYMSLLAVSVLAGCSRTADLTEPEETQEEIMISGLTRVGSASDVTYRTLLLNTTSGKYLGLSGSYRAKDAKEWMTACQVNAAGEWIADDTRYGLRTGYNSSGKYLMTVVSPAVAPDWHFTDSDPDHEKWGFNLDRGGSALYISHPQQVSIAGNHVNKKYVYQFPEENKLTDRRAKVTFKLQCGEDLESVHVDKIEIKDIYSSASFNLALDSLDNLTVDPVGEILYPDTNPEITLVKGEAPVTAASDFYLFALDYVAKDDQFHYIYSIPRVVLHMGIGKVSVPFYHNLKPQYSYTYTLIINSAFIRIDVTSEAWTGYDPVDASVDPPFTDTFIVSYDGWTDVDGGTGTIG